MNKLTIAITLAALTCATGIRAAETSGAGSTFVQPIIAKWSAAYEAKTGNKVRYQAVGSSVGLTQVKMETVDFAASDMPLLTKDLNRSGLMQFPLVIGAIVPVVHLDGVKPGDLRLTGSLLAEIFLGHIRFWNDPAITKLNPTLKVPNGPITVVHRVEGSGTTFNWTDYLSKVSPAWKTTVGEGSTVQWPVGIGGKGNEGVAALVDMTPGSIGYVEYTYAMHKGTIAFCLVENEAGNFPFPNAHSFKVAASTAKWDEAKDFSLLMTNAPGGEAYPIAATVFVVLHEQPKSPERVVVAMDFFKWALDSGEEQATSLEYVSLPPDLVAKVKAYWKVRLPDWKG